MRLSRTYNLAPAAGAENTAPLANPQKDRANLEGWVLLCDSAASISKPFAGRLS